MRLTTLLSSLVLVLSPFLAQASITTWSCQSDGAIATSPATWSDMGSATYMLQIAGPQYSYPAHLTGGFTTDAPNDPTVWLLESVENQTSFAWTGYHIDIGLSNSFSIVGVVSPADWTWAITAPSGEQPLPADPPTGTGWVGTVDYYAGTPIGIGQSGNFGIVVSFQGSVDFYTAQTPVPEPGSAVLLAAGALFLRQRRR